jgi:hypothetical protein
MQISNKKNSIQNLDFMFVADLVALGDVVTNLPANTIFFKQLKILQTKICTNVGTDGFAQLLCRLDDGLHARSCVLKKNAGFEF